MGTPISLWLKNRLAHIVLWASGKFGSQPDKDRVHKALSQLLAEIEQNKTGKGVILPFDAQNGRFIIFSDQHKGAKNRADDFMLCEPNYLAALDYYLQNGFHFIALGDCEELWENRLSNVLEHQQPSFDRYKKFIAAGRFYKLVGNHDLDWQSDPFTQRQIKNIFGTDLTVYDGILLQTSIHGRELKIFCTHGHQGDKASDGNWFSKFFVSKIWAPLQIFSGINPNTPAYDNVLKSLHNQLMYEWSAVQEKTLLITGHTHQPIFESLTHLERLYRQLRLARRSNDFAKYAQSIEEIRKRKLEYNQPTYQFLSMRPTFFNSGCCCYNDGDITGLEIAGGSIRLIKWARKSGTPQREVLEEKTLQELVASIK